MRKIKEKMEKEGKEFEEGHEKTKRPCNEKRRKMMTERRRDVC
jgi:hypothetical protein